MGEQLCRDLVTAGWHVAMADIQENPELSAELGDKAKYLPYRCLGLRLAGGTIQCRIPSSRVGTATKTQALRVISLTL